MLFTLTGCKNNGEAELKEKVISELDYVNSRTIDMLNKLNNLSFENYQIISQDIELKDKQESGQSGQESGSSGEGSEGQSGGQEQGQAQQGGEDQQSQKGGEESQINATTMKANVELGKDRNNIDWEQIKKEIEDLNESWSVVVLDLYALNVNSDTILDFSNKINSAMISITNEDKEQTLSRLADLYSSIPEFLTAINADPNIQKIRQTQSYVIQAYSLSGDMGNTEINNNVRQAVETYSEIMGNIDFTKDKTEKTNRVYVLLNELSNSLGEKNPDVFFIKYKNFMKEIEKI